MSNELKEIYKNLYGLLIHLTDYGKIEGGTPQSRLLIDQVSALGSLCGGKDGKVISAPLKPDEITHVENLLTTAIEGGSNYWYMIINHNKKNIPECEFLSSLLAHPEGWMTIGPVQDGDFEPRVVKHENVIQAWQTFTTDPKYKHSYGELLTDSDDANTGDIFFQLVVLGEVIFG